MESPLTSPSFFPAVPRPNRQSHIPIRSITYKKALAKPDIEIKKEMASTMGKFPTSSLNSPLNAIISPISQTRASTQYGSKPGSSPYLPHMSCEFHRLTFTSNGNKNNSPAKSHSSALLPNLRSPKATTINPFETNYSEQHTSSNRAKAREMLATKSPQNDYFKLLFDENRKPFKVEDYSGVDEFYTPDMIMKNIYDQGFRDPQYYGTRIEHRSMEVPSERSIQDEYRFKMPVSIASMENHNTLATHVLGGTQNNINFVESSIGPQEEQLKAIKAEKNRLQNEIEALKKKNEDEIRDIEERFMKQMQQLQTRITEDSINNQNENFKCQKEIALLQRDKLNLEKDIESLIPPLERLEDVLYGQNIFALKPNEGGLERISSMNLRPQLQSSMKNKPIIH